ncbi:MAG: hypothetical protein MN733_23255 [Nitrososphaera sp.]|nr:hypothetical protein [Nitrososphaera sp.]
MNRFLTAIAAAFAAAVLVGVASPNAFALVTPHPDDDTGPIAPDGSEWGAATKDFAPLGDHSSSQDSPRSGLGNLAQSFGSWCGLLDFLGSPCS